MHVDERAMKTPLNEMSSAQARRAMIVMITTRKAAVGPRRQHPIESTFVSLMFSEEFTDDKQCESVDEQHKTTPRSRKYVRYPEVTCYIAQLRENEKNHHYHFDDTNSNHSKSSPSMKENIIIWIRHISLLRRNSNVFE